MSHVRIRVPSGRPSTSYPNPFEVSVRVGGVNYHRFLLFLASQGEL